MIGWVVWCEFDGVLCVLFGLVLLLCFFYGCCCVVDG